MRTHEQRINLDKFTSGLRSVPDHKFSFMTIVQPSEAFYDRPIGQRKIIDALLDYDCGTTACAAGYLPTFFPGSFKYMGVSLATKEGNTTGDAWLARAEGLFGVPAHELGMAFGVLGMPYNTPFSDVTKEMVADRLDMLGQEADKR